MAFDWSGRSRGVTLAYSGSRAPLAGDTRGVTVIEFALISSVLIMLMTGIVELSLVMTAKNSIEAATNFSLRLSKTGFSDAGLTREETIMAELERRAGSIIDVDKVSYRRPITSSIRSANPSRGTMQTTTASRSPANSPTSISTANGIWTWVRSALVVQTTWSSIRSAIPGNCSPRSSARSLAMTASSR
ncbi:MAG: pilus assembly protein [Alphaproteobacteria bacterium]|nr:pilus assembly protein [Alphaproteobacteria bacterium]